MTVDSINFMLFSTSGTVSKNGKMNRRFNSIWSLTFFVSFTCLLAASPRANTLSFEQALRQMQGTNKALSAAKLEVLQQQYERQAVRGLYYPTIGMHGRYSRIDEAISIDLNDIRSAILFAHADNPALGNQLPSFETSIQDEEFWNLNASLKWPIYTGGRIRAANRAAEAQLDETGEKLEQVESELFTELVQRYFGLRLAKEVVGVRQHVLAGMKKHLENAQALEKSGMVPRAERLHAEVFHAEAEREYQKALREVEMVETALSNTLSVSDIIEPTSKLFVFRGIGPVSEFQSKAIENNPILKQVASQRELAHQASRIEAGRFQPEVFVFGQREVYEADLTLLEPNWVAGIGVNFNLFEGFSRQNRLRAARTRERRIAALGEKAQLDISALVEKRYHQLINALEQYESTTSALVFAEEYLRVRVRAFEEGLGVSLNVVDAQLAFSRVQIDRLTAMYRFDVSLARLLETSGHSELFETYRNRNDVEVEHEK